MKAIKTFNTSLPVILLVAFACLVPDGIWAQDTVPVPSNNVREDFSDDELKSFVKANEKVMAIQTEAEQKMIKAIEDEGLTLDRFNAILEEQRDPQRGTETSADELKSFNNAAQVILDENARVEQRMVSTIEQEGIDVETYKQIMLAYQQSPAIKTKVNKMVSGEN